MPFDLTQETGGHSAFDGVASIIYVSSLRPYLEFHGYGIGEQVATGGIRDRGDGDLVGGGSPARTGQILLAGSWNDRQLNEPEFKMLVDDTASNIYHVVVMDCINEGRHGL